MSLIIEMLAHMDAGDRRKWGGDQDARPLSELGQRQANRLCDALARDPVHALYSSAALRARQTVEPLAQRFKLPVIILPGLHETDGWLPPPVWRDRRVPGDIEALGGAFAAGAGMQALGAIRANHSEGRVVACTHGDVLPSLIVYLIGALNLDLPAPNPTRGGWYTLVFEDQRVDVQHHDVLQDFPL
jgi:broad specificity phosphatase PhoE